MGQREVSSGELIKLVWDAEDRVRAGASCLARRKLTRGRSLGLVRFSLAHRLVWVLVVTDRKGDDVFDFSDGTAAWRAAIGWDGKGEPEGFARYRRRA